MKLKYPVGKTVARLVRHAWAENKALFFRFCVYTLAAAIYPMLAVALPKLILGELTQAAPSMERLTWIVVGFSLRLRQPATRQNTWPRQPIWSFASCGLAI